MRKHLRGIYENARAVSIKQSDVRHTYLPISFVIRVNNYISLKVGFLITEAKKKAEKQEEMSFKK